MLCEVRKRFMRDRRLVVLAALFLAACPGDRRTDESNNSPAKTSTTTSNPQAVPENSTAMNPIMPPTSSMRAEAASGARNSADVGVQLTDYQIRMPDVVGAGSRRFKITNSGKEMHNFVIEGPGISRKLNSDLGRGDSIEVTVQLKPGSYTIYCPVDGHRGKGMQRTLVVK